MQQLGAARRRIAELEAAAGASRSVPPCGRSPPVAQPDAWAALAAPLLQSLNQSASEQQQQKRYPDIYSQSGTGGKAAGGGEHVARAKRALAEQLQLEHPPQGGGKEDEGGIRPTGQQLAPAHVPAAAAAPAPLPQYHTAVSLPSVVPVPAAAPAAGMSDLQQVFAELHALQQRLQAAEQRLQAQAANPAAPLPPPESPGGGSRPSSPGAAARPACAAAAGHTSGEHGEHRDSWQLIRELKERRAKLETGRTAACSAALASCAVQRDGGSPSPPWTGARAAVRLFDSRDLPPPASQLQQPLPIRPAAGRPASASCSGGRQQPAWERGGRAGMGKASGRERSPMAWHAANQRLPGPGGDGTRGRRRSVSAVSITGACCGCCPPPCSAHLLTSGVYPPWHAGVPARPAAARQQPEAAQPQQGPV